MVVGDTQSLIVLRNVSPSQCLHAESDMFCTMFVFLCTAVKFISSISEHALIPNIFMSLTQLEDHQSPDTDLVEQRKTTVVICTKLQLKLMKTRPKQNQNRNRGLSLQHVAR